MHKLHSGWLLVAALSTLACGKQPTGRYNVVLISLDSTRADRTGPYGHRTLRYRY